MDRKENEEPFNQVQKSTFLVIFIVGYKSCIDEGSMPLIEFIDW